MPSKAHRGRSGARGASVDGVICCTAHVVPWFSALISAPRARKFVHVCSSFRCCSREQRLPSRDVQHPAWEGASGTGRNRLNDPRRHQHRAWIFAGAVGLRTRACFAIPLLAYEGEESCAELVVAATCRPHPSLISRHWPSAWVGMAQSQISKVSEQVARRLEQRSRPKSHQKRSAGRRIRSAYERNCAR